MCCTPVSMIQRREEVCAITSYMVFPLSVKKKEEEQVATVICPMALLVLLFSTLVINLFISFLLSFIP